MSPYKSFIGAAKTYLESVPFLKFLLSAYIYVFSLGGLIFLLGSFIPVIYDLFTCVGGIIVFAGLLLTLIKEDMLVLVISSGALSFIGLVAWIVGLVFNPWAGALNELYQWAGVNANVGFGSFHWQPFFYFLIFGTIAGLVFFKSEKFKKIREEAAARNAQMRAEAEARDAQMRAEAAARNSVTCPHCGTAMPNTAGFCPNCGAPNPAMQYAPPQYAPPAGQQPYAPPQYAPPAGQQPYAPSAAPQYAPPPSVTTEPAASAEPVTPMEPVVSAEPTVPAEPVAPAVKHCVSCGAELPAGAVFCGKCGTKQ